MKNLQKSGKYRMNQKLDAPCQSFPWTVNEDLTDNQAKTASSFMRNAVNELGVSMLRCKRLLRVLRVG